MENGNLLKVLEVMGEKIASLEISNYCLKSENADLKKKLEEHAKNSVPSEALGDR